MQANISDVVFVLALTLIAAGGVNLSNAKEYAATGVDGLATTCLHFAKLLDMSVRMKAL